MPMFIFTNNMIMFMGMLYNMCMSRSIMCMSYYVCMCMSMTME